MRRRPSRQVFRRASPTSRRGRKIGLLGGSFNPAHEGHRHVSLLALRWLGLDEVWWLVSPQNPLKPTAGMAPFEERLAGARRAARHPRIRVSDLERRLGSRYTVETVHALQRRHPGLRFVWLMGADNLSTIADWHRWPDLFRTVPIAIFDRWPDARSVAAVKPALRFAHARLGMGAARGLAHRKPPAWALIRGPLHPASATALRTAPQVVEGRRGLSADAVRRIVTGALNDARAGEVATIDLAGKTAVADFMVVASGRSGKHVGAAADRVLKGLKEAGAPALSVEGREACDWVLIDAGDVIAHVFRPEIRALYDLEKLWTGGTSVADRGARSEEAAR